MKLFTEILQPLPIPIPDMLCPVLLGAAIPAISVMVGDMAMVSVAAGMLIESMVRSTASFLFDFFQERYRFLKTAQREKKNFFMRGQPLGDYFTLISKNSTTSRAGGSGSIDTAQLRKIEQVFPIGYKCLWEVWLQWTVV